MKRLQAFKFELRPDGRQRRDMSRFAGSCRFVFNKALALQHALREEGKGHLGYAELCELLAVWKRQPENTWLTDAPSQTLQQSLKDLGRAYRNFFERRANAPVFKRKGRHDSFRYPQGYKLDQIRDRIFLPKLGWIRYRSSREVVGDIKNITVSQYCGKWFASIQTEREVGSPLPVGCAIGIDMGIVRLATLSDGTFFDSPPGFKRHQERLAKAQRRMSHIQKCSDRKFGRNWQNAKARVAKVHAHIRNARKDLLHKVTTTISKSHAMVCVEDLPVRGMVRSASGTEEKPGRNVRVKASLNKRILNQGWFEFRRQLNYKLAWNGGHLVLVPPRNTSLTCPTCGHIAKGNRPTQSQFECLACGFEENADVVGAMNVLRAGHARLACEVNGAIGPSAAGTHRSDPAIGLTQSPGAVGINGH